MTIKSLDAKNNSAMDSTYFRTKDVIPFVDADNNICMWNGKNYEASWGSSNVTSKVTKETDTLIVIQVTGWHKHTISPVGGTYYFVKNSQGQWERKRGNSRLVMSMLKSLVNLAKSA